MAIKRDDLLKALMKDFDTTMSQSDYTLKKQCDRLAGYAHVAIQTLVDNGQADFVFLKHDGMREWYHDRLAHIKKQEEAAQAKLRKAEVKERALARLTDEEKEALGLKKK